MSQTLLKKKLLTLMMEDGLYDLEQASEFLEPYIFDGVVPGICLNEGCDHTDDAEPDATENWCEACETNTVCSALELLLAIIL